LPFSRALPALFLVACSALAQPASRAILVDGEGPWRDSQWTLAATEFSRLLADAGYSVTTVSPADLPAALGSPDILVAVPSLESLPVDTFRAVVAHQAGGGNLMASGGEPFRNPLAGSTPPDGFAPPTIETLSPWYKQYTNSAGLHIPIARGRGLTASPDPQGRYRVIGDVLAPAATFYTNSQVAGALGFGSTIIWLPWTQIPEPLRTQFVAALAAIRLRVSLWSAGPEQIAWLPGEDVTGRAYFFNASKSPAQAVLQWSVSGAVQPAIPVSLDANNRSRSAYCRALHQR
jgi:hypothetical protein